MKRYKISTAEKKNVFIRSECVLTDGPYEGKTFYMSEWYRWGNAIVEVDDDADPPAASEQPYDCPLELDSFDVIDENSDDGCSLLFDFDDDLTEEEFAQYIDELWNSGEFWEIVDIEDRSTEYYGPLEVEELNEAE